MPEPTPNPLTEQHLTDINAALSDIKSALSQAELATRAGIDVTEDTAALKDYQQKLNQIKQVYFPGQ